MVQALNAQEICSLKARFFILQARLQMHPESLVLVLRWHKIAPKYDGQRKKWTENCGIY